MRPLLAILIFISFTGSSQGDWRHVYAGAGITIVTAEVTNQLTDRPVLSTLTGLVFGVSAGFAKECIYDRKMERGTYNKWDLVDTSWGAILGAVGIGVKFHIENKKRQDLNEYILE